MKISLTNLKNVIEDNYRLFLIILSVFIFIILMLLLISINTDKNKKVESAKTLELVDDLYNPREPNVNEGFTLSREELKDWNNEENESFFENPQNRLFDQLRKENEQISNKLLENIP